MSAGSGTTYAEMNEIAAAAPVGAEGLIVLPYGNGAERTLGNGNPGASIHGLNFNIHQREHLLRAGQEGIVFALNYGLDIMRAMGLRIETVKAGYANMFLSPLFRSVFTAVTGTTLRLFQTDGSEGAARGAGIGAGIYGSAQDAFRGLRLRQEEEPDSDLRNRYEALYGNWKKRLEKIIPPKNP
jgi:xylulokinase